MSREKYVPSEKEIKKAEGQMTEKQAEESEKREEILTGDERVTIKDNPFNWRRDDRFEFQGGHLSHYVEDFGSEFYKTKAKAIAALDNAIQNEKGNLELSEKDLEGQIEQLRERLQNEIGKIQETIREAQEHFHGRIDHFNEMKHRIEEDKSYGSQEK